MVHGKGTEDLEATLGGGRGGQGEGGGGGSS